jgi:phosphatidylinositol 3-kinase
VLPLPLDARVRVEGIAPEASTVFKSNLFPLLLQFERSSTSGAPSSSTSAAAAAEAPPPARTEAGSSDADAAPQRPPPYGVIFKNGDDLRQDQLVMQLFTLMDRLLRNENLDLRMTPYRVLATGPVDGMVQFVESKSIAAIVAQHGGSLLNYLRAHHPDESSPATYGVAPVVLDTFVRSCGESASSTPLSLAALERWLNAGWRACSWILCRDVPPRRRRPASGQSAARARRALFPRCLMALLALPSWH